MIAKTTILILTLAATITASAWFGIPRAISNSADFKQQVTPVGKGPGFIAIADVNHDGKLDLLVANMEDGSISVLLGDGKGHFTPGPGSPFPCNPNPNDIVVADMNGDGNPDLVIANHQTPYITVLLGDGMGGFKPSPHSPFATRSHPHPHGVAVADFMGDGKPAVVTDSWGSDQILLMPSDGKGNLILPESSSLPMGTRIKACALLISIKTEGPTWSPPARISMHLIFCLATVREDSEKRRPRHSLRVLLPGLSPSMTSTRTEIPTS